MSTGPVLDPRRAAVGRRVLPVPADVAFDLLTDVRNHARWVPATRIEAPERMAVGDTFTAVSTARPDGSGRGLVDRMVLERLDRPTATATGVATYRKTGPVLRGGAELRVRPLGPTHCEVTWVEQITLRGVPVALTVVTDVVSKPATTLMLRHLLAAVAGEVAAEHAGDAGAAG